MTLKSSIVFVEQYIPECINKKPLCEILVSWTDFSDYYVMHTECTSCGYSQTLNFQKGVNTTLD